MHLKLIKMFTYILLLKIVIKCRKKEKSVKLEFFVYIGTKINDINQILYY